MLVGLRVVTTGYGGFLWFGLFVYIGLLDGFGFGCDFVLVLCVITWVFTFGLCLMVWFD